MSDSKKLDVVPGSITNLGPSIREPNHAIALSAAAHRARSQTEHGGLLPPADQLVDWILAIGAAEAHRVIAELAAKARKLERVREIFTEWDEGSEDLSSPNAMEQIGAVVLRKDGE